MGNVLNFFKSHIADINPKDNLDVVLIFSIPFIILFTTKLTFKLLIATLATFCIGFGLLFHKCQIRSKSANFKKTAILVTPIVAVMTVYTIFLFIAPYLSKIPVLKFPILILTSPLGCFAPGIYAAGFYIAIKTLGTYCVE